MATVKGERFAPILVLSLGLGVRRGEALGLRTKDINWEVDDGQERTAPAGDVHGNTRGAMAGARQGDGVGTRDERAALDVRRGARLVLGDSRLGDEEGRGAGRAGRGVGSAHSGPTGSVRSLRGAVGEENARPVSVTIAKSLRYIAPAMRAEGEDAYRLTGTKTGETREIPLPRFVADMLAERLAERDRELRAAKVWAGNDLVFCAPNGNSVALETLRTWFLGALKRAGLPVMRWHDLRSSCATVLYEMDVPEVIIMAILGHKDLATTRLYKGKTPQALELAAKRIDEAMG